MNVKRIGEINEESMTHIKKMEEDAETRHMLTVNLTLWEVIKKFFGWVHPEFRSTFFPRR